MCVLTDSYKAAHFEQYPDATRLVAYGEFRTGLNHDQSDTRIVVFGIRFLVEKILQRRWTMKELEDAEKFYRTHKTGNAEFPFPKELFRKFIIENDGYFPVKFEALTDGMCVHAHVPIYQITAEGCYAPLCTFLETMLTMVWYPTTVATLSRRTRDVIEDFFKATTELSLQHPLIESRLHDFGFRGCTTVDQAVIGGCAHLLNFTGTDTMAAAYYAQFELNDGEPVGSSIPATEHSVMTAWDSEKSAVLRMIHLYGEGLFACVMDSYDYVRALENLLPAIAKKKVEKGGFMVLRPDSGDPAEAVVQALRAADSVFGSTVNAKGFRVLKGCGVIQGDGMTLENIAYVLRRMKEEGYSAENCAFGMGGGLLQKINRDTMSFATKLSHIVYADGRKRDIMKTPQRAPGKLSLPGRLAVKRVDGIPTAFAAEDVAPEENLLHVYYDKRPCSNLRWDTFSEMKKRVREEWMRLAPVKGHNPISEALASKIKRLTEQLASPRAS